MIKNVFILFAVLSSLFVACDTIGEKLNELAKVSFNHTETVEIEASDLSNLDQNIYNAEVVVPLNEDIKSAIDEFGVDSEFVEKVYLEELTLIITAPIDADFSFLVDFEFFASSDNIEEVKIASVYDVPATIGNELTFEVNSEIDLYQFLEENELTLKMNAEINDNLIVQDYTIDIEGKFTIELNVIE